MEFTFIFKYQLADDDCESDVLVERLGEAGCDNAVVGMGQPGRLALEFTREAESAEAAMRSALADVRHAVPSARLIAARQTVLRDIRRLDAGHRRSNRAAAINEAATPTPVP